MDRQHNHDRVRDIVVRHRVRDSGEIDATSVPLMLRELTALLDECVEEANADGFEEARQEEV